jgi:hypothetical protein
MTLQTQQATIRPIPGSSQQITPTVSTGLTVPAGASLAVISTSVQAVRYKDDGSAPDTTHGILISVGAAPYYYWGDLNAIRFFNAVAGAIVDVLYYATN